MSLPYSAGPHYGKIPGDHEALGVAGEETLVLAAKHSRVDLRLVAS